MPQRLADAAHFRPWRDYAAVLSVAMIGFTLAAPLWCWMLRPEVYTVTRGGGLEQQIGTESASFGNYGKYVVVVALLALLLSLWTFFTRRRGLRMLLWVTGVSFLASWWLYELGARLTAWFRVADNQWVLQEGEKLPPGAVLQIFDMPLPGVALLVAPFVACLVYWAAVGLIFPASFERLPRSRSGADRGARDAHGEREVRGRGRVVSPRAALSKHWPEKQGPLNRIRGDDSEKIH